MKKKIVKKAAVVLLTGAIMTTAAPGFLMERVYAADVTGASIVQQSAVKLSEAELKKFAESFFAEAKLQAWGVPGAVFAVVQDNKIVYQQGFGAADVAAKSPVQTNQTAFRVGSVSKVVTATALMQLVEQGKVKLDAGVNDYLPGPWISYSPENPVTIAHLLTHTTGFEGTADLRPGDIYTNLEEYYDLESYVKESVPETVRKPGEAFKYDNFASMLQGYIVEHVSKMSFEDYVQKHIFEPLGMKHSGFRNTPEAVKTMATGYIPGGQAMPQYGVKPSDFPQGGWYTTAEDAAIFMMAQLNKGSYQGVRILKPETAELMQKYHVFIQPDTPVMAYGFEASMFPQYDRGQRVLTKGGDIMGFSSCMWLLPEHNLGFFVSVNTNNGTVREELYRDFMKTFMPDISTKKQPLGTPAAELKKFEGTYRDLRIESWKSKIAAADAGKLTMEDAMFGQVEFTQTGPMTFVDKDGIELVFKANDDGVPQYFKYRNIGYSTRSEEKAYADVSSDSQYAPFIQTLQGFNIFKEEQDRFRPEEAVTRGEYIAYFVRLLKLPLSSNPSLFSDMAGHRLEKEVQTAAELGLVNGLSVGSFAPDRALTRQEAAVIVHRLLLLQGAGVGPQMPMKEKPADWAADAVNMMLLTGFFGPEVKRGEDGSWDYRPQADMLRKEAAAMLAKLVQIPSQAQ